MPTKIVNIGTVQMKILAANSERQSFVIKNYTSISLSGGTAPYVRVADQQGNVDAGDAHILADGDTLSLCKAEDGDAPTRAWWARCATGTAWISILEIIRTYGDP